MENQFGKKEKILVGIIIIFTIIFIPYLFISDKIKREKSVRKMEKISPAIQCGIDCRNQAYELDSQEFGDCVSRCLNNKEAIQAKNKNCGVKAAGENYDIGYCNKNCQNDRDCVFTCGCGAINVEESCYDEGIRFDCVDHEARCENKICMIGEEKINVVPGCVDGFTYMSYYPNLDGSTEFSGGFSPSEELKKIRVAYYTFFACSDSEEEGYYIKINGEFKKAGKEEFYKFIEDYNASCNNCLTEHFDGCC